MENEAMGKSSPKISKINKITQTKFDKLALNNNGYK